MEASKKKSPSPIAWVLGQAGSHGEQFALSVILAVLGEIRKRCTEKLTRMPLGAVLAQSSGALKTR